MLKILSPQLLGLWRRVNCEAGNQCPCKRAPLKSLLILCSACEDHGECSVWEAVEVYFQLHIYSLVMHILRLIVKWEKLLNFVYERLYAYSLMYFYSLESYKCGML